MATLKDLDARVQNLSTLQRMDYIALRKEIAELREAYITAPVPPPVRRFEARRTWPFGYHVHYNGYTTVRAMTLKRLARKLERYAAPRVVVSYCKSRAK